MLKDKKKNLVIITAMIAVMTIGSISAYFTATDSQTNRFTVGSVEIDQTETTWDAYQNTDDDGDGVPDVQQITPNHEFPKNPQVVNTGENGAYVYTMVAIPKKTVRVANSETGVNFDSNISDAAPYVELETQLFQMNKTAQADNNSVNKKQIKADQAGLASKSVEGISQPQVSADPVNNALSWTGVDTFNDDKWFMLKVNPEKTGVFADYAANYNIYLFAYAKSSDGSSAALTELKGIGKGTSDSSGVSQAERTTPALFSSVTMANVVNINDLIGTSDEDNIDYDAKLEFTIPQILVKSFAIQADNLTSSDSADADTVWGILNDQNAAYKAFADELHDLDAANNAWQTQTVKNADHTVNTN